MNGESKIFYSENSVVFIACYEKPKYKKDQRYNWNTRVYPYRTWANFKIFRFAFELIYVLSSTTPLVPEALHK